MWQPVRQHYGASREYISAPRGRPKAVSAFVQAYDSSSGTGDEKTGVTAVSRLGRVRSSSGSRAAFLERAALARLTGTSQNNADGSNNDESAPGPGSAGGRELVARDQVQNPRVCT